MRDNDGRVRNGDAVTVSDLAAMERRILKRVADALRGAYSPGYHGKGGPQDGDDEPPSFDARWAADQIHP